MTMHFVKKPEAMIFDVDGTLFQTEALLIPVYHEVFDTCAVKDYLKVRRRRRNEF